MKEKDIYDQTLSYSLILHTLLYTLFPYLIYIYIAHLSCYICHTSYYLNSSISLTISGREVKNGRKEYEFMSLNPLSAKSTKWPNTLKQFVGHFVGLTLKGLITDYLWEDWMSLFTDFSVIWNIIFLKLCYQFLVPLKQLLIIKRSFTKLLTIFAKSFAMDIL